MINGPAGYDGVMGGMRTEMKAGPGIDISHGTISTTGEAGVPYIGGTGINITGATVETDLTAGYRMEIISGATIGQVRYMPVETVSGSSVTMQAGHAYKIYATSAAVTLNTETIPANSFGLEGHLEIYVAGTGYVITGTNVVLANALEPDSVNNLTARFHDGLCILSVEDHVAGYIVTVNAASGAGSLAYGLATSTNEYISVDASLNGQTLDLAGTTTYAGEKHVVGNGYTETIISGGINCTSKTTFSNLSMAGVIVSSGTLTLGDAYIPNGSTVAVSGGGLAVEKVTGAGETSVIEGGATSVTISSLASGVTFSGFCGDSSDERKTALFLQSNSVVSSCTITGGTGAENGAYGGALGVVGTSASVVDCIISGNYGGAATNKSPIAIEYIGKLTMRGCTVHDKTGFLGVSCALVLDGQNHFMNVVSQAWTGAAPSATVTIASGATVDLTGNTNATPIAPGGVITFAPGGATILYGATAGTPTSSAVIAGASLEGNTALGNSANVVSPNNATGYINGGTFTSVTFEKNDNSLYSFGNSLHPTYSLINCSIAANILLSTYSTPVGYCTVEVYGTLDIPSRQFQAGNSEYGLLHFMENLAITTERTSGNLVASIGTLIVDSGVTLNGVDVVGGTYHKATMSYDGTITEA